MLALGSHSEVCDAADKALKVVSAAGWQSLAWQLHALRATALLALGQEHAVRERQVAIDLLMTIAKTFENSSARSRFLSQPIARKLFM